MILDKGAPLSQNSARNRLTGRVLALVREGSMVRVSLDCIKLWEVASGRARAQLNHNGAVRSLAFTHDSRMLASGSNDFTVKLWDVASGTELATLTGHEHGVRGLAFSPDDKTLVTKFIPRITVEELEALDLDDVVVERSVLQLMKYAKHRRSIQVINGLKKGNLTRALNGEPVGTVITA